MYKNEVYIHNDLTELIEFFDEKKMPYHYLEDYKNSGIVILSSTFITKEIVEQFDLEYVIVVSSESDEVNIEKLLKEIGVSHIVGTNSSYYCEEIVRTIAYLNHDHSHFTTCLSDEANMISMKVTDSKDIDELIEKALDKFDFAKYFDTPRDYFRLVGNELLSNAVYHPEHKERSKPATLPSTDAAILTLGMNEEKVAISVKDSFGKLQLDQVRDYIFRGVQEKAPMDKTSGAGLGLYLVFSYANEMIIKVSPGVSTEIVCVIDKNKRYKKYRERITSFHFFKENPSE